MKILLATDTYPPHVNGTSYFIYRFAHALAKKGHKVFVVAPAKSFKSKVEKEKGVTVFRVKSLPVLFYPQFRFIMPFLSSGEIKQFVLKTEPDIIHLQQHFLIGKQVFEAAKENNTPAVGTNHFLPENLIHYFPLPKTAKKLIVKNTWNQFAKIYNELEYVTTPTPTAAKLIEHVGLKNPPVAISNGIDQKRFNPKNANTNTLEKYKIPKNKKILIFVGRLDKEKQIDVLLKAVAITLKKVDFHFVVAGIGAQEGRLKNLAQKLDISQKVTFAGFVKDEDLPSILASSKVFIIAGLAELQSIATMEAMASGLPVIAANAKALPELVKKNVNGFLVSPKNYKAYAQKIEILMTNEKMRKKMAEQSLEIIKKHSEEYSIREFTKVYKKAIARSRKH